MHLHLCDLRDCACAYHVHHLARVYPSARVELNTVALKQGYMSLCRASVCLPRPAGFQKKPDFLQSARRESGRPALLRLSFVSFVVPPTRRPYMHRTAQGHPCSPSVSARRARAARPYPVSMSRFSASSRLSRLPATQSAVAVAAREQKYRWEEHRRSSVSPTSENAREVPMKTASVNVSGYRSGCGHEGQGQLDAELSTPPQRKEGRGFAGAEQLDMETAV